MNQSFSLDLLLHYWFFVNQQMTTEWEFAFLSTAIIIFCSMYPLNISVPKIHNFFLLNTQYPFLQNPYFDNILRYRSDNFEKIILSFLFVWFCHCPGRQKYKRHSFVYRFQALNPNSIAYLRFINCYGKANKKSISGHSETWLDIDRLLVSQ